MESIYDMTKKVFPVCHNEGKDMVVGEVGRAVGNPEQLDHQLSRSHDYQKIIIITMIIIIKIIIIIIITCRWRSPRCKLQ